MRESSVRRRIVEVAGRLFYDQGYNLTSINHVIDEAGIARGSLYNHFDSKEEILLSYLEKFQVGWFSDLDAFLLKVKDPKKKILALFDFRIGNQQRMGFGGCPIVKANAEIDRSGLKINQLLRENRTRLKTYILGLVQQSGHRKTLSDESLTELIYLSMDGALIGAAIYKDTQNLRAAKKVIQQLL